MTRAALVEAGSIAPPGPVGRVLRLLLGLACGWGVVNLVLHADAAVSGRVLALFPGWWIFIALGLWVFPAVVSIGLGLTLSPPMLRRTTVGVFSIAAVVGQLFLGSPFTWPLGSLVYVWLWYTYGHFTLSLLLAALIATPGCEMRAIPHLWGHLTGRPALEHGCPGLFTPIDRWEANMKASRGA